MSLRFHEIVLSRHRILNPFSDEKLDLLGSICAPSRGQRHLDLACGKGELLCRWAQRFGTHGVGVDLSAVFLGAARDRAEELGVADLVTFHEHDAATLAMEPMTFDIVSCLGATWIGNGMVGTLELMRRSLRPDGLVLVGDRYWIDPPPIAAYASLGVRPEDHASLIGTLDRIETAGFSLVEMVLADTDCLDRYRAMQWWTVRNYLRNHPEGAHADDLRDWLDQSRRNHLEYGRRYFGWGVFVVRPS